MFYMSEFGSGAALDSTTYYRQVDLRLLYIRSGTRQGLTGCRQLKV